MRRSFAQQRFRAHAQLAHRHALADVEDGGGTFRVMSGAKVAAGK